ncbi:23S rRNA methyltransferase [Levilactobacillus zymae]|uniref:23S rRNA methyltransferase n=1 Tax=Levilactobacillus zymae TaxID=267363 RepID=A0ABQ0WZ85_9LACO|nr:RNA methyltransferase [Levilactobacillus zymae]KRL07335.1 rRNA methylase [Levilactobacillus zymae DSM 19395]QFR60448.1 RNA methyltransferase [Levilactobacillus zymae]GEO71797.1 23S rRNA methyltransferase [Levilactobacillus zymae]
MKEKITSSQNKRVKQWRALTSKKGRKQTQSYLLEGWHLVQEALKADQPITAILGTADQLAAHAAVLPSDVDCFELTDSIAKTIGDANTPQGIFATMPLPHAAPVDPQTAQGGWLFLDQVQDPGNIGTMVRTADAAGLTGVVFGRGSASRYLPKVLRSMQGSQFHVQLVEADLHDWIQAFTARHLPVYGTNLDPQAQDYRNVDPVPLAAGAVVMGNEGNGMAPDLQRLTTRNLYIPIKGQAESLNVAVAAGIVMFRLFG